MRSGGLSIGVLALVASLLTMACSAGGSSPGKGDETVPPRAGKSAEEAAAEISVDPSSALRPEHVRPYFIEGAAARAQQQYALEDFAGALQSFRKALSEVGDDLAQQHRIELMIAQTSALTEDWAAATSGFEAGLARFPLLTDWIHYQAARAYYFSGDHEKVLEHARAIAADSTQKDSAELLIGDVLRGRADHAATAAHYRNYLDKHPNGLRRAEARYQLGLALTLEGKWREAAAEFRYLDIHAPTSPWAERALTELSSVVKKLSAAEARGITEYSAEELLTRGLELSNEQRNDRAEVDLGKALTKGGLSKDQRCLALFSRADCFWKLRNRTQSAPLFEEALVACNLTGNVDLQVKSAYQAARSYDKLDEEQKAIDKLDVIETKHADHSYADDARLRKSESYEELGDIAKMREALATIPQKYPDGDMKPVALWRLGWDDYKNKRFKDAIDWFEKQIQAEPLADHWARAGQAQYWIARSHGHLGNKSEEIKRYRETIRLYPLSYYALLSFNRLRERYPSEFEAAVAEVAKAPADPGEGAFVFKPRAVYGTPPFQRALEMLRLGLTSAATAELSELGFRSPPGKSRLTDEDEIDKTWAFAFLNHHAGRYAQSHWVTRWHVLDYKRNWPVGAWRAKWDVAYPKAFWPLLDKHAKQRGYPSELQIAFVREESAFDPLRESWANAVGLTQMIHSTAERFGKGTGIAPTRENLRDPEKNVIIGANFLQFLYKKWNGNIALVVPSYNTGENRVARWLREKPHMTRDEFSEDIPLDEPLGYNKRVTESFFIYSYLNDGTVPVMPL